MPDSPSTPAAPMRLFRIPKPYVALSATLGCLVVLLVAMQVLGTSSRHYLPQQQRFRVAGVQQGYDELRATGVRGRVLVLFDRTSRLDSFEMEPTISQLRTGKLAPTVAPDDLIAQLIYAGIVRSVYVVYSQAEWPGIDASMVGSAASRKEGDHWLTRFAGAPVVLTTTAPKLGERAIVYVAGDVAPTYSAGSIAAMEAPSASDVIVEQAGPQP